MATNETVPEVWQRGPIPNVPSLLQPVAHTLLQAREEISGLIADFDEGLLWATPGGVAAPGFHLKHLSGVIDRLFTYALGNSLTADQLHQLKAETIVPDPAVSLKELVDRFNRQVDQALLQLEQTDERTLTEFRGIGRKQLPSTVIGLLVHAAEHTMRHVGQLNVTVRILKGNLV